MENRTLNISRERGNCLAGRILGIERGRAVKQERRDLTVLEKSSDTFEELKYRSVKHKVVGLYGTYVKSESYIFLKIGVNNIGSRHPMCSKGQSNKIFASDFFRNGFLPSPYSVSEDFRIWLRNSRKYLLFCIIYYEELRLPVSFIARSYNFMNFVQKLWPA